MAPVLGEALLDRIETLRIRVGRELGLDPDQVPAYELEGEDVFPVLGPGVLERIERGEGRDLLARTIDHTLLKPEAQPEQIVELCSEAIDKRFIAVCVNGVYVPDACSALGDSGVLLAAVVGFPLGAMSTAAKAAEARIAVEEGAGEIDMVLNVGWLKAERYDRVFEDVAEVVKASGVPVKVILETCLLTDDEKITACHLSRFAGAAFVKTSTGFGSQGATEHDVALMRAAVGHGCGVKASGGVRSLETALAMLRAGANRIGTSSGVKILG